MWLINPDHSDDIPNFGERRCGLGGAKEQSSQGKEGEDFGGTRSQGQMEAGRCGRGPRAEESQGEE
jgi:hypothetical protein